MVIQHFEILMAYSFRIIIKYLNFIVYNTTPDRNQKKQRTQITVVRTYNLSVGPVHQHDQEKYFLMKIYLIHPQQNLKNQ